MEQIDFNHCTVFISARSPFARRVRITLLEHGVPFQEKVFDVLNPTAELLGANPLARVPAIVLSNGKTLIDSNFILPAFYEGRHSPLEPVGANDRILCSRWSALAVGLCERLLGCYLEKLRPESQRDQSVFTEFQECSTLVLSEFEKFIGQRKWILSGQFSQCDIDMGVALAYLSLRHNEDWKSQYPQMARYFAGLDLRPSFEKTRPPK